MWISNLARKPTGLGPEGNNVPDPVDQEGKKVSVTEGTDCVVLGTPDWGTIQLDAMQAEELAFAILTVVEAEAGLSYTIQRNDRGEPPRFAFESDRTVVEDLSALRKAVGISQSKLAERSGLRREIISRLEKGGSNPTVSTLHRFGAGLGGKMHLTFTIHDRIYDIELPHH